MKVLSDCHISHFGFSNKECSLNSKIRFDINDFDESFIVNLFLDVIRFGVSIGFFFDELNKQDDIELIYKKVKKRVFDYTNEKLLKLEDGIKEKLIKTLDEYEIIDICKRKSVGIGSSHLNRYYMLVKKEKMIVKYFWR